MRHHPSCLQTRSEDGFRYVFLTLWIAAGNDRFQKKDKTQHPPSIYGIHARKAGTAATGM